MDEDAASYAAFRRELFASGLLVPTGIDGLYLRSGEFEHIVQGIDALVSRTGVDEQAPQLYFPLVVPRSLLERTGYVRSFANLIGSLQSFTAGESAFPALIEALEQGGDWTVHLDSVDLALCSAGCHPLYPTLPSVIAEEGRRFEIFGQCFRHEPSIDPARMQAFRQHEFVYVGTAEGARAHRDRWVERGLELHESLGLKIEAVVANDPFFGRTGSMLAANQVDEQLKIELVAPICSTAKPTAITSANCHLDHFGETFGIELEGGGIAHSACVGFGLERIALALLHTHGLDERHWPPGVRAQLER